jgi:hypothetical protein
MLQLDCGFAQFEQNCTGAALTITRINKTEGRMRK